MLLYNYTFHLSVRAFGLQAVVLGVSPSSLCLSHRCVADRQSSVTADTRPSPTLIGAVREEDESLCRPHMAN